MSDDADHKSSGDGEQPVLAEIVEHGEPESAPRPRRRRLLLPALLFIATCLSTLLVGHLSFGMAGGAVYAAALMLILTTHEMGHFLQARRHGVPVSWPMFIPMPLPPIGTMGAVILMQPGRGDRKAIFDIGISGPLAGLVPAIAFSIWGITMSKPASVEEIASTVGLSFGQPLLFQWLSDWQFGTLAPDFDLMLHPLARAGWVGIFLTAVNLVPIGQLDGGHVLYALLRKKAHLISIGLLLAAAVAVVVSQYWPWSLMILMVALMRPRHPPTANDNVPLGWGRIFLGWLTLMFLFIGFTPQPLVFYGMQE